MADVLCKTVIETPVGPLVALASQDGLCMLEFGRDERLALQSARLRRWYPGAVPHAGASPHLQAARAWLTRYFAGRFGELETPVLDARGTSFELAVWRAMRAVGIGTVSTYAALAARVGRPNAARAVGAASRCNPVCMITPCHRIIGSDGSLVGYGGGLELKHRLLQHEGALPASLPGLQPFPLARRG